MPLRVLAGLLFVATFSSLRAADESSYSCTLKSDTGGTYTLQFQVPPATGCCQLVALQPTRAGDGDFGPAEIPDRPFGTARYWKPYDYISSRPYAPDTRPLSPLGRLLISGIQLKKLGTVTTNDGKKHGGARLVTADQDGVIILSDDGFYRILNADLDPDTRQRMMTSAHPAPASTGDSLAGL